MNLTERQKKYLRGLAHARKPVVMIGAQGLTGNVWSELDKALTYHELIKIRVRLGDRAERQAALASITDRLDCTLVQRVGNTAVLYRQNPDQVKVALPRAGG